MVDIRRLAKEQQSHIEWQQTPNVLTAADFCGMIEAALRKLYVLTGRAALYNEGKLTRRKGVPVSYDAVLAADEVEFVLVTAEIAFFRKTQTDVNNTFGYSTDALTITNADKPYANLSATIRELESQQRILYYKMTRYNLL